jgi:hypothetical protein
MKVKRDLVLVAMTPADVLATIRDSYRFAEQLDSEAEPDVDLTFTSTITQWRQACDLVGTHPLGRALNRWFGVAASDKEWRAVLTPPDRATLNDVCKLIVAKGATRPAARPARVAGVECSTAGAFLTLRALLAHESVHAHTLRPSTPLSALGRPALESLIGAMGKLAPGILPVPRIPSTAAERASARLVAGVVPLGWYPAACLLGAIVGIIALNLGARLSPAPIVFDASMTLGALARAVAQHRTPPT